MRPQDKNSPPELSLPAKFFPFFFSCVMNEQHTVSRVSVVTGEAGTLNWKSLPAPLPHFPNRHPCHSPLPLPSPSFTLTSPCNLVAHKLSPLSQDWNCRRISSVPPCFSKCRQSEDHSVVCFWYELQVQVYSFVSIGL